MTPEIPQELVAKYDKAGPRYTSYPPVPVWTSAFDEHDYRQALEALAERSDEDLAIYLHLPFCVRRCLYCGCNSLVDHDRGAVDRYLDLFEKELALVAEVLGPGRRVVQMHWGGGTPNYLKEPQIERCLGLVRDAFDLEPEAELSLEIDPRIASPAQAAFLRRAGFNRISLGVQDFSPRTQKTIGRRQSRERTLEVYHGCREAGFDGVNIDLVYGLPGQTADSFVETLDEIITLRPDRVACFSYAHVPWAKPEQKKIDTSVMLTGYDKFRLFQRAVGMFQQAGYAWIGIDHFARAGDELALALERRELHRNFMGYTTRPALHMLAFGMSGIGDICDRFVQNAPTLAGWTEAVGAGRLPIVKGHRLSDDDRLRRLAILNLMCNLELPFDLTEADFGSPADELLARELGAMAPLEADGLVRREPDRIAITERGRFFVRNVAMTLDAYLTGDSSRPVYSKTI